ncbi:MAG: glycosyltransferase 87 family protein, partial [Myxococcota bacterium]|nr:glycosyltransferase 87 family protein [Myxococcota bacterium]
MRPHPRDPSPRVAIAIGVIALAAAIASVMPQLAPNTWIFRDGRFYVNVATTIVEDLTIDQHAFAASWYTGTLGWNADLEPGWSNVALGARGEHWPKHPWIHPLIASPVYFAFGLPATLAWNLLMFALIASGLYRFARAYAEPAYAAMGVAIFVLATAIRESAYDFSVDVLMLAVFAQGLAAVLSGRGVLAGVCIALAVVIKPTALMLMPALVLTIAERRDRRTLGRSLGAGTIALLAYAAINWWMYGRPWWSGYNRTLVTQRGAPVVADHLDAFSTPFAEGFARMWGGYYGLAHTFTALVIAAPGLIVLLRRRPLHAIGAILGVAASLVVFAKYEYEGHRFHWPALALLVPALAMTLEVLGAALAALRARMSVPNDAPRDAGRAASLALVVACAAT